MGALTSRQSEEDDEIDLGSTSTYRYPPKSGFYFGGHFIMGGEKFEATQPETYLFGENSDLNFLNSRPAVFPYPTHQPPEPTKTLRSLINIRKESLRLIKASETESPEGDSLQQYNIEFTFDSDVRCAISIYYFCNEEITSAGVVYAPRDESLNSEPYHYKSGANQQFCQVSHTFCPGLFQEEELLFTPDSELLPVVIHCTAAEGDDPKQSHITIAVIEKCMEGIYVIKTLKQKQFVDGLCYLLQEIYGIENKNSDQMKPNQTDDEIDDSGAECVICMSDVRNTLILPCRHFCLCNSCANSLRHQANNCPICRSPFRALLRIRALRKVTNNALPEAVNMNGQLNNSSESQENNIPPGYEPLSLLEALNGTSNISTVAPSMTTATSDTSRDSPLIPKRHLLSRMLSGSNASLQGRRKNLSYKVSNVSLSEPNVTNVGKDKVAIVPIDYEDAKPVNILKTDEINNSNASVKSAAYLRSTDSTHTIVDETKKKPNEEIELMSTYNKEKDLVHISAPDSLELPQTEDECNKLNMAAASPLVAEEDSDYYTPEDPTPNDPINGSLNGGDKESKSPSIKHGLHSVKVEDESKRSSTDSFSSASSTSKLITLPNQVPKQKLALNDII
ncbi:E3 ubiquitin ligase RNF157 [Nymphon striatum]|nr:E3 ubiquitin ligase RNF157 [Nymphon striatum]